ncbi:putative phosphatidylinositol-3,4-bisphosphate 4-phosphatase [Trypoxylus dichotomus]
MLERKCRYTGQHNNDSKRTSKAAKAWSLAYGVNVTVWPARSLDLNAIEHLWGDIKRKLSQVNFSNREDFWQEVPRVACNATPLCCYNTEF